MGRWKDALKIEKAEDFAPTAREQELLDRLAGRICRLGMTTPAILFLETARPLNFIGSQFMAFWEPVIRALFDWRAYREFYQLLERRGSIEALLRAIEQAEARREAEAAACRKSRRKLRRRSRQTEEEPTTQPEASKFEDRDGH